MLPPLVLPAGPVGVMLLVVLAVALGRACVPRVPTQSTPTFVASKEHFLWSGPNRRASNYSGGMLGVHAEVSLNERDGVAALELSGLPVGGRLAGTARFDASGGVRMEPHMEAALARRFVRVVSVRRSREDVVEVVLRLPLLGLKRLGMSRI